MATTFSSGKDFIEELLGDIHYSKDSPAGKLYPFFCRIAVIKRRPPRHEYFQWFLEMGRGDVVRVLERQMIKEECLTFVFPERWMNQPERQSFTSCITKNPGIKNIKYVDIITTDPLLVGSFHREQLRIVTWPEDSGKYDCSAEKT